MWSSTPDTSYTWEARILECYYAGHWNEDVYTYRYYVANKDFSRAVGVQIRPIRVANQ